MLKSLFPWKHHKTKAMAAQQTMDDEVPEANLDRQQLAPCHVCGRTFLPAPLKKHERICEKTSSKKRKPFDSLKQRVEGTDLADFHQKSYLKKPEPTTTPDIKRKQKSTWKEKHLALVSAIRAAKGVPPETTPGAPPKIKSTTALMAGTERCPSCDRQFGPKAYDRHVEWCKEKKAQQRIHHSPANVLLAKERLEARTKYVPPLNRGKKTLVREKYSNHTSTETLVSVKGASPLSRGPSVRKPRSVTDVGKGNEKTGSSNSGDRLKLEKGVSGSGDKAKMQDGANSERCVPVIASPSSKSDISRNVQKKRTSLPFTKLNDVHVNRRIDGLTVASLKYDSVTKKMVTWRDTVKKTAADDKSEVESLPSVSRQKKEVSEVACKVTQSERLARKMPQVECDKIVSCGDILHKNQPAKIPLSKYSFKSKLNLTDVTNKQMKIGRRVEDNVSLESNTTTAKSSFTDMDSSVEMDKRSSCNSVANAFEKLTIGSDQDLKLAEESGAEKIEKGVGTETAEVDDLESDSLIDVTSIDKTYDCLDEKVLATRSVLGPFQNDHNEMSEWFDEYVKKSESADCIDGSNTRRISENSVTEPPGEEEGKDESNENLVLLFKSTTHLDLTTQTSDYILAEKKSERKLNEEVSQETFETNCELDSIDLSYRRSSFFSLKKSSSDICVSSTQSNVGLSGKNTLVSIYWNQDRETDEESTTDIKRMFSSLPNVHFRALTFKEGVAATKSKLYTHRDVLRRRILEIAAKEFVEDCHKAEETAVEEPVVQFLEEEYTVPKKRRKVDGLARKTKNQKIFHFSGVQNFDLDNFKKLTVVNSGQILKYRKRSGSRSATSNLDSTRSESTLCGASSATSTFNDYSPRIFAILDNVLGQDNKKLMVVTPGDCRRLIDLDREKLPELQRRLRRMKKREASRRPSGSLKLPAIEGRRKVVKEDKEIQVSEIVRLPQIVDKKLRRRDNGRKLEVDIRKDVGDVYLEYDSERDNFTYNPFESAQRQFMELLECDDFQELAPTCTPVKQHTVRPHTSHVTPTKQPSPTTKKKTVKSAEPVLTKVSRNANRASVIEPPTTFKDSLDSVVDDFELMENLINDNFTDDNKNNLSGFFLHKKETLTLGDILNNRKYSDDMSTIDPMLINENDNLSIPDHFITDDYSPTSTIDTDITIQNDVDHYSVQYDTKIEAFEPKTIRDKSPVKPKVEKKPIVKRSVSLVNRAKTEEKTVNTKLTTKSKLTSKSVSSVASTKTPDKKKGLSTLKRSMTLFEPSPKPPSLKNKNDVNNYFSEQEQKISANIERNSPGKEINELLDETLKPEDLFNVDDEMYEEYKKYEEMYLKEKAEKSATKKHKPKIIDVNLGIHTASEEEEQSQFNNKISNDSAYGSLTRKTPKHRSRATKLTPLEQKQVDSSSSSGSENCPNSPAGNALRTSKFCHECGNRYPVTTAKFCVECGVKRLVL